MSENYIVINGKKAELTEEQLEKLGIKPEKTNHKDIFDRRPKGEVYFNINRTGGVNITTDAKSKDDDEMFNCANYCADSKILHQRALHETLDRLLWRASVIAGELNNKWDMNNYHYYIYHNIELDALTIGYSSTWKALSICYFPTEESAKEALENIVKPFMKEYPDFVW